MRATIEYDGTDFCGWQLQAEGRTVQGVLEEAILRVTGTPTRLHGAGRTDAGVHAEGQTAHFDTDSHLAPEQMLKAINHYLPRDICLVGLRQAPADFHARFSATSKLYRYQVLCSAVRRPLRERFYLREGRALDLQVLQECAALVEGEHDFASFVSERDESRNTRRHILRSEWVKCADELHYLIEGDGFLYNMVRALVGTMLEVGRGKRTRQEFADILKQQDRSAAGVTAPPQGLTLVQVNYPP